MSESIDDLMPNAPYNEQPTLRDRFAMAALTGMINDADVPKGTPLDKAMRAFAKTCYDYADVMMEARKK